MVTSQADPYRTPATVPPQRAPAPVADPDIAHARRVAEVMDRYFVDPILGFLLPGVGDVLGSLIGCYIIVIAHRKGVAPIVIARMVINVLLDAVLGIVPVIGDLADFAFKANTKNLELLEDRHATGKATRADWGIVIATIAALIGAFALVVMILSRLFAALGHLF